MPFWLTIILPIVINALKKYGIPFIEAKWPALVPIIDEILALLSGPKKEPSMHLITAANKYNESKTIFQA